PIWSNTSNQYNRYFLRIQLVQFELRVTLGSQPGQFFIFTLIDESHSLSQLRMHLGQVLMHLLDEFSIARVSLRAGPEFMQMERLTGVIGNLPAHTVAKQCGVLRLIAVACLLQE